jgi:hypothetical protein
MAEYEPDDSRDVTLTDRQAPGEPPRTGPREGEARAESGEAGAKGGAGGDATDGRPVNEELARKDAQDAEQVETAADRTGGV